MTDVGTEQVTTGLIAAASHEDEQLQGATFPALNAMIARLYMHTYKVSREELAQVSVQNHANGSLNPLAHFQRKISTEAVLNAPIIADPLTLLDCSPISDGAASVILCSKAFAEKQSRPYVHVLGFGQATDTLALADREDLLSWKATTLAAEKAFTMAGVTNKDIDVIELHDAFSVLQPLALEDLGFAPRGQGLKVALPVNPSGGLKSRGHPVGATGVAQVVEIVSQLRGTCGERQVSNARVGLTHNVGGCGTTVAVCLFGKEGR